MLLPRAAVEANLSFALGRPHALHAKDHFNTSFEFTLQSWANGIESRRVYVLEHAGEYIRRHVLKLDDVIGISCTEEGEFLVEYNTEEVCAAAESQQAARGQASPLPPSPLLPPVALTMSSTSINPLIQHNAGRCTRSEYCNKPAGHPGFCMRTPGGAAGRSGGGRGGRRGGGSATHASYHHHAPRPPPPHPHQSGFSNASAGNVAAVPTSHPLRRPSLEDIKRASSLGAKKAKSNSKAISTAYRLSTEEEDNAERSELDESDSDSDWGEEERNRLARMLQASNHNTQHMDLKDALDPAGPFGPPIFTMAPDADAPPPCPPTCGPRSDLPSCIVNLPRYRHLR